MGLYKKKDSPNFYCNFKTPGKERVVISTRTSNEKLAEQIYIEKRSLYQKVGYGFERPQVKISELFHEYLELYSKHSKVKEGYQNDIVILKRMNKFFGDGLVHTLTAARIEQNRIKRLSDGICKSTVNREMAVLKHVFNKGIEWGKCLENPVTKIKFYSEKENKRTRFLDMSEKTNLLNACPMPARRLVYFALSTGMRRGEILNLKWKDVDFKNNIIKVTHSKSGKPRYVNMNNELSNMLKSTPTVSEYVFGTKKGKAKFTLYRKPFEAAVIEAGISDFHFHDLRHCFASDLVMKGVDLKTVSELLGHSTTIMTERYSHLSPSHKRIAVELLPKGLMCYSGATEVLKEEKEGTEKKKFSDGK